MKKFLFLLTCLLFSSNVQVNNINQTNVNHQIERTVPVRNNVYGDNISFEDVNVNLSSLIGIEGYWYGTNNIVFDINEQFEKEGREYITLILKEYDVNPYLEIALFYDDGELLTNEYILNENTINMIKSRMVNKDSDNVLKEKYEHDISYLSNYLSRIAIENENNEEEDTGISTYTAFNHNAYLASEMTKSSAYIDQYLDEDITLIEEVGYYVKADINDRTVHLDDNTIVNIIPKQYFSTLGSNYYFGKEYGFYINTYKYNNREDLYESSFIVVKFEHLRNKMAEANVTPDTTEQYFDDYTFGFKLSPVINGFTYYDVIYKTVYGFHGGSNLCVDDIEFEYGIRNKTEPNVGDDNYSRLNDNGLITDKYFCEVKGVGKSSDKTNIDIDNLNYLIGMISAFVDNSTPLGLAVEILDICIEIINYIDDQTFDIKKNMYEEENNITINTNGEATLKLDNNYEVDLHNYVNNTNYIYPYKGFSLAYNSKTKESYNEDYPLLLKNSNHSYNIEYNFRNISNQAVAEQLCAVQTKFYIKQDNSDNNSSVIKVIPEKITKSWQLDINTRYNSNTISLYEVCKNHFVQYSTSNYTYLKFIPHSTGYYYFKTGGYPSDTTVDLLNSGYSVINSSSRISYTKHDIYSSTYIYNLDMGRTYYFRFKNDKGYAGCTNFFGSYYDVSLEENDYTGNYSEYCGENYTQIFDFVPQFTDRYLITTSNLEPGEYVDTYLEIYDSSFRRIGYSDDVITPTTTSTNAELEICLKAGEKYFICTKPSTVIHDVEYYAVNVMRMRTISGDTELLSYPAQYTYTVNTGNNHPYLCLKFRPEVTGTYRFEIAGTYAYNYVMSLWGNSYSFIKFNSNYSSGIPYISHTLYSSSVYYVFIEQESLIGNISCNFIVDKI